MTATIRAQLFSLNYVAGLGVAEHFEIKLVRNFMQIIRHNWKKLVGDPFENLIPLSVILKYLISR